MWLLYMCIIYLYKIKTFCLKENRCKWILLGVLNKSDSERQVKFFFHICKQKYKHKVEGWLLGKRKEAAGKEEGTCKIVKLCIFIYSLRTSIMNLCISTIFILYFPLLFSIFSQITITLLPNFTSFYFNTSLSLISAPFIYINGGELSTEIWSTILPGDTPLKTGDSPFLVNHQMPIAPQLWLRWIMLLPRRIMLLPNQVHAGILNGLLFCGS